MQESAVLDELELRIINALQINPRASWTTVGQALEVDPSTAARRWAQLRDTGRAWISVYPAPGPLAAALAAFIEVECAAGEATAVAERLVDDPRVGTIEHVTGSRDLLLTVVERDLATLGAFVLTGLGRIPGVRGTRAHVATALIAEAGSWHLRTLSTVQAQHLRDNASTAAGPFRPLDARDTSLIAALTEDGRSSYNTLAERTGLGVSTVRRRVESILTFRQIVIRCEVAQALSGWPVTASLWCRLPPSRLGETAAQLAALPETRLCAAITGGRPNLLLTLWLRSVADIQRLEAALADRIPELEILDRGLTLRHVKRLGRVLDADGQAAGVVPLQIWT
ncbi:Lrp/AsnC family transcriptional regulator [Actinospica sp.]|jgi:DNA-binding Lrp family transcriptional regulator|uniref:Lrp/AsnC family transcriptional regulator n=1 Tax=Actinospica sp. TaxID=1872142 RepID=UPI002CABCB9C|nr:Lrp/AsnC family transcriptional regulator [Actinospica sp.]HWG24222.1 Lrp/AsnC family transcriptional regulator [Actinospica sp.]